MKRKNNHLIYLLVFLSLFAEAQEPQDTEILPIVVERKETLLTIKDYSTVTTGAQQTEKYLPLLKNKRVGIVTNVTGIVGNTSLVDTLVKLKVNVKKIFSPEHGFRGDAEAGEKVGNGKDSKTNLPVISLYGANKKPTKEQLKNIDVLVFDIQDVGVRFYTYISTLHYVMEACAENGKECIVLDRPNPNGFYIDGPVLQNEFKSFLGTYNTPIVYGMTIGEYAQMLNGEKHLNGGNQCQLTVIELKNYDRKCSYNLPVKPSPNLPNTAAVLLYPSLGLFEGTIMSVGRGTDFPFQVFGHPEMIKEVAFIAFTPRATALSKEPKYVNQVCYGFDFARKVLYDTESGEPYFPNVLQLEWLITSYQQLKHLDFFDKNFNYHAGNKELQEQIKNNVSEDEIRLSWQEDLEAFKLIRKKYLLYEDF